jgi:hypothetical protein
LGGVSRRSRSYRRSLDDVRYWNLESLSIIPFDGYVVLVFRDDGSDYVSMNSSQSRRTFRDAV